MGLFSFLKIKKRKYKKGTNHIKTLIKLAYLNGQITKIQRKYLIETGKKFNFSSREISRLIKETKANTTFPKSNFKQDAQFKSLVGFVTLTPSPTSEQKSFFLDIAEDMGINREEALASLHKSQEKKYSNKLKIA